MREVYPPSEDTLLLLRALEDLDLRVVRAIDVGSGSGILTEKLAEISEEVHGVDVSVEAVRKTGERLRKRGVWGRVSLLCGDLLKAYRGSGVFDLIVSNPPYLEPEGLGDKAIEGGIEFIQELIIEAAERLKRNGILLMVFSSRTGDLRLMMNKLWESGFSSEVVEESNLFFEKLYVLKAVKASKRNFEVFNSQNSSSSSHSSSSSSHSSSSSSS